MLSDKRWNYEHMVLSYSVLIIFRRNEWKINVCNQSECPRE